MSEEAVVVQQQARRAKWLRILRIGTISLSLLTLVVSAALLVLVEYTLGQSEESARSARIAELHSSVRFIFDEQLDHVYGCNDGSSRDVPCPDYIATVEFKGDEPDQPPVLTPARDASGKLVLDFVSEWDSESGMWRVVVRNAADVRPFAINQQLERGFWVGAIFVPGIRPLYSGSGAGLPIEIYAADMADSSLVGKPLPKDRFGS